VHRRAFLASLGVGSVGATTGCLDRLPVGSADIPDPTGTDHVTERRSLDSVDPQVGAHYYPWYGSGNAWKSGVARTPTLGKYDSRDPDVIAQHVEWARRADIDFLSVSWWGPDSYAARTLREHMLPTDAMDRIDYSILYELNGRFPESEHPIDFDAPANRRRLRSDFEHLADAHFGRENHATVDGRPLMFVYHPSAQLTGDYAAAMEGALDAIDDDPFVVADFAGWFPLVYADPSWLSAVDAVTAYDWYDPRSTAFDFDADESFDRYLDRVATEFTRWHLAARDHDVAFVPATMPGYDDSAVRPEAETPPLPRSVKRFREQTALATDFLDPEYPLAYITTFNEWHEDTAIEPAPAYGESYLDAHAETKTASPATPALDEYASVTLSFSDTEGEARALATTLRALELADSDKTVAAYDIGVPADEPVITEGAYDIESDGDRTWRWLGGSAARTVVYVPAEQLSSASTLRLFGQPKPSGLSADVTVAGDSLPSLALDQPATGVGRYEVDLSSVTVSVPIATE